MQEMAYSFKTLLIKGSGARITATFFLFSLGANKSMIIHDIFSNSKNIPISLNK